MTSIMANNSINVECNYYQSCKDTEIFCSKFGQCNIVCSGYKSCENSKIYCSNRTQGSCAVSCQNSGSCDGISINYYDPETSSIQPTNTGYNNVEINVVRDKSKVEPVGLIAGMHVSIYIVHQIRFCVLAFYIYITFYTSICNMYSA